MPGSAVRPLTWQEWPSTGPWVGALSSLELWVKALPSLGPEVADPLQDLPKRLLKELKLYSVACYPLMRPLTILGPYSSFRLCLLPFLASLKPPLL